MGKGHHSGQGLGEAVCSALVRGAGCQRREIGTAWWINRRSSEEVFGLGGSLAMGMGMEELGVLGGRP